MSSPSSEAVKLPFNRSLSDIPSLVLEAPVVQPDMKSAATMVLTRTPAPNDSKAQSKPAPSHALIQAVEGDNLESVRTVLAGKIEVHIVTEAFKLALRKPCKLAIIKALFLDDRALLNEPGSDGEIATKLMVNHSDPAVRGLYLNEARADLQSETLLYCVEHREDSVVSFILDHGDITFNKLTRSDIQKVLELVCEIAHISWIGKILAKGIKIDLKVFENILRKLVDNIPEVLVVLVTGLKDRATRIAANTVMRRFIQEHQLEVNQFNAVFIALLKSELENKLDRVNGLSANPALKVAVLDTLVKLGVLLENDRIKIRAAAFPEVTKVTHKEYVEISLKELSMLAAHVEIDFKDHVRRLSSALCVKYAPHQHETFSSGYDEKSAVAQAGDFKLANAKTKAEYLTELTNHCADLKTTLANISRKIKPGGDNPPQIMQYCREYAVFQAMTNFRVSLADNEKLIQRLSGPAPLGAKDTIKLTQAAAQAAELCHKAKKIEAGFAPIEADLQAIQLQIEARLHAIQSQKAAKIEALKQLASQCDVLENLIESISKIINKGVDVPVALIQHCHENAVFKNLMKFREELASAKILYAKLMRGAEILSADEQRSLVTKIDTLTIIIKQALAIKTAMMQYQAEAAYRATQHEVFIEDEKSKQAGTVKVLSPVLPASITASAHKDADTKSELDTPVSLHLAEPLVEQMNPKSEDVKTAPVAKDIKTDKAMPPIFGEMSGIFLPASPLAGARPWSISSVPATPPPSPSSPVANSTGSPKVAAAKGKVVSSLKADAKPFQPGFFARQPTELISAIAAQFVPEPAPVQQVDEADLDVMEIVTRVLTWQRS